MNKLIALSLVAALALTGCKEETADVSDIVLVEPVNVQQSFDYVTYRNLYDVDIFSSVIAPSVTEYSFSDNQTFKKFGASPGTTVSAGDVLAYSDTLSIDKQIKDLNKSLTKLEEDTADDIYDLNVAIADGKDAQYEAGEKLNEMYEWEPDQADEAAYKQWEKMFMGPEGAYKRTLMNVDRQEQALKEKQEYYDLEHAYKEGQIARLQDKINDASVISKESGEVVAANFYFDGDYIPKDMPVIAIGDTSVKILRTDYISKSTITKALDVYAVINGKRYEVDYEPMEADEYSRLTAQGETVYTTFHVVDPDGTTKMGDYAVIVVLNDYRENVLTIPEDSLFKESDSYYTYLFDGENSTYTSVEIGMRDGTYAEVLSGLSDGDRVLSETNPKKGANKAQLSMGMCCNNYDTTGFLYYPFSEWLTNPADSGTSYVSEILVSDNEIVTKGQVVAKVEVVADSIEKERISREILRHQERLVTAVQKQAENEAAKKIDRSVDQDVREHTQAIEDLSEELDEMNNYSGIIEIKAPYDGIITDAGELESGDLIYEDSKLVQISDYSSCYIIVSDENNQLSYGDEAVITYQDSSQTNISVTGTVVTVGDTSLSNEMNNEWALISVPMEELEGFSVAALSATNSGRWDRASVKVSIQTRKMDNVLLIPKNAVTKYSDSFYVNVLDDDGTVRKITFLPGGSDQTNYWVVEGLSEGMTVCWE